VAAADALKRVPVAYWALRRVRMTAGDLLPARTVPGVPGPVHRNDVMFASASDGSEYARTGADAARFVAAALEAAGIRPERGLDLGSGHGRVLRHLVREVPVPWTACDIDGSAVRFCARAFGATPARAATPLRATRWPSAPYGVTWMGSLVTHLTPTAEADLWATLDRIGADRALVALSVLPPAMVNNLAGFGPGMGAAAPEVASGLIAQGAAYVPYPHHRRGDYGVAFHDPARLVERVAAATGRSVELVAHEPGAWDGMQDYVAVRLTRR
jgi:hypothetical protein